MSDSADELARTATAATAPASSDKPQVGVSLGRYKLERELGTGGMGVVYAAFDPDLQRRIALKILRSSSDAAGKRLLREARAMARLAHPNVVTVHEVGSASGRDFIAMELLDGGTLGEWLRAEPRSPASILDAFLSAGRGLAAAHAAQMVHRDFKPQNVLRGANGRIVVTDFGLARDAVVDPGEPVASNIALGTTSGSTPLGGLTETGSVLGTPAYMAPEQWEGGAVTPTSDQFAFCVALWEAFTGERPYRGGTLDELKANLARGPASLDGEKIPRHVRDVLLRGLDPDPAKRWPSMEMLLARLARTQRNPRIYIAAGAGAAIAATIAVVALGRDEPRSAPAVIACEAPARDPDELGGRIQRELAKSPATAAVFAQDLASWHRVRNEACAASARERMPRLACLDAVLARLEAVHRGALLPPQPPTVNGVASELVDPIVCTRDQPPKLQTSFSDAAIAGLALGRTLPYGTYDEAAEMAARKTSGDEPCGRALLALARARSGTARDARQAADEAVIAGDLCGDDRMRADAALTLVLYLSAAPSAKLTEELQRAAAAVERVGQADLRAYLEHLRAQVAQVDNDFDTAIAREAAAIPGFARLPEDQVASALSRAVMLVQRRGPGDLALVHSEAAKWLPIAKQYELPRMIEMFQVMDATAQWFEGDIATSHARLVELFRAEPVEVGPDTVAGVVVDAAGKPVAGVDVAAGSMITSDSVGVWVPLFGGRGVTLGKTDAAGRFSLNGVGRDAVVAAADRGRSGHARGGKHVRIVLGPVGSIRGRLAGVPAGTVLVRALAKGFSGHEYLAPVAADGSFTLDGVPQGTVRVGLLIDDRDSRVFDTFDVEVEDTPTQVDLGLPVRRELQIIVRSESTSPLAGASVIATDGNVMMKTLKDFDRVIARDRVAFAWGKPLGSTPPPGSRRDDFVARIHMAPLGAGTVCGWGIQGDLTDPAFVTQLQKSDDDLEARCVKYGPDDKVVTLKVPSMKRLD